MHKCGVPYNVVQTNTKRHLTSAICKQKRYTKFDYNGEK